MKRLVETIIILIVWLASVSLAEAINVTVAEVQNGIAVVAGNKAPKNAAITWETDSRGLTTKGGSFNFSSSVVPADCVGELSIVGADTINVALANCTPTPTPTGGVLKTGQTQCETGDVMGDCPGDTAGQDGELQSGLVRSYTDNGATITDNATGLEWEKLCDGQGCPVVNDKDTTYNWAQAFQKIADLNAANFAGHNDWRVPNINELQSLVDFGRFNPPIDPMFNNNVDSFTPLTGFWSSTTYQNTGFMPDHAWYVRFSDGMVFIVHKSNVDTLVRAVRGP